MNPLANLSVKALFRGVLVIVVTFYLLLLFTPSIYAIFLFLGVGDSLSERAAMMSCIYFSLALGGYVSARVAKKEGLLHGFALGVIIAVLNLVSSGIGSWSEILDYGFMLASPVAGAYVWLRGRAKTAETKETPFFEQESTPRKPVSKKIVWAIIGAAVAFPIIAAFSSTLWQQSDVARQKMAFSPFIAFMNAVSALVVARFLNAPFFRSGKNYDRFDTRRLYASIGGVALFFVAIFCISILLSPDQVGPLTGLVLPFYLALSLFSFIIGYGIGWIVGKLMKQPLSQVRQGTSK